MFQVVTIRTTRVQALCAGDISIHNCAPHDGHCKLHLRVLELCEQLDLRVTPNQPPRLRAFAEDTPTKRLMRRAYERRTAECCLQLACGEDVVRVHQFVYRYLNSTFEIHARYAVPWLPIPMEEPTQCIEAFVKYLYTGCFDQPELEDSDSYVKFYFHLMQFCQRMRYRSRLDSFMFGSVFYYTFVSEERPSRNTCEQLLAFIWKRTDNYPSLLQMALYLLVKDMWPQQTIIPEKYVGDCEQFCATDGCLKCKFFASYFNQ
jgi:hypothetical protein